MEKIKTFKPRKLKPDIELVEKSYCENSHVVQSADWAGLKFKTFLDI